MDPTSRFSVLKEAISSISGILWPVGIIALMLLLTRLIPGFRQSQKKGKLWPKMGGGSSELDELEDVAAGILKVAEVPMDRVASDMESLALTDPRVKSVMDEAKTDLGLAILRLSALINEEARLSAGRIGSAMSRKTPGGANPRSPRKKEYAHPDIAEALKLFSAIGAGAQKKRKRDGGIDGRRCLDAGMTLYIALKSLNCENG